jgi:hypothetical protein
LVARAKSTRCYRDLKVGSTHVVHVSWAASSCKRYGHDNCSLLSHRLSLRLIDVAAIRPWLAWSPLRAPVVCWWARSIVASTNTSKSTRRWIGLGPGVDEESLWSSMIERLRLAGVPGAVGRRVPLAKPGRPKSGDARQPAGGALLPSGGSGREQRGMVAAIRYMATNGCGWLMQQSTGQDWLAWQCCPAWCKFIPPMASPGLMNPRSLIVKPAKRSCDSGRRRRGWVGTLVGWL